MKILLISKEREIMKGKNKGKKFYSYFTKMNLVVDGEEEKGKQVKWVNIKFRSDVKNNTSFDLTKLKSGYLVSNDFNAPLTYKIEKDEDGNNIYPTIWIRSVEDYQKKTIQRSQDEFILEDEEETESTEFKNNDNLPF